jgi:hypothetical protein
MATFYVSDQEAGGGVYKFVDGVLVANFVPVDGFQTVAYIASDGAGNIVATGQPSQGSGGSYQAGLGWLLDADLNLVDGMWGATLADGTGYWRQPSSSRVYFGFNPSFDGTGAIYEPTSGNVLLASIFRGFPDEVSAQDSENQILHVSPAGQFLKADADSNTPPWYMSVTDNKGVAAMGGKVYLVYNATSLAEYDVATGVVRTAYNCFYTVDPTDLVADATTGKLWVLPETGDGDGNVRAKSFLPASVPWGTSSPNTIGGSVPFVDQVVVSSDNFGFGYYSLAQEVIDLTGDGAILTCGYEWVSGDLSFYTVPMTGGAPTLIYQDTAGALNGYAWDILAVRTAAPNLTGGSLRRTTYFGRGR